MKKSRLAVFGLACALLGAFAQEGVAEVKKAVYSSSLLAGKNTAEKAAILLDGAAELAGGGSWEQIAVGRAWYLGGNKEKGQGFFDRVTSTSKVEASDWYRVGLVYLEAHESDKAKAAFDHAMALTETDSKMATQIGAAMVVAGDAVKGESAINTALTKRTKDFWGWLAAGGAYLNVTPTL